MTTQSQEILRSFELLPDIEKREVASEIIRRSLQLHSPPLSDEELTSLADELFLQLDRSETNDA
jgi:hypothetical protein